MAAQDSSEKKKNLCPRNRKHREQKEVVQVRGESCLKLVVSWMKCVAKRSYPLMNHTSDREIILQKMKETFEYRQRFIHNPDESHNVLSVFPRLLDTKGLVIIGFLFCNHNS